jgi:hypothetical protein
VPGTTTVYATNKKTGREEKYCDYTCSCSCDNGDGTSTPTGEFSVQAFSTVKNSSNNSLECLYQYDVIKQVTSTMTQETSDWEPFKLTTGLIEPPPIMKENGWKPYPSVPCQYSPQLCKQIEEKCDECGK